jgi:hypothetical protein
MRLALVCLIGIAGCWTCRVGRGNACLVKGLAEGKLSDEQVRSARTLASGRCWKTLAAVQAVIELVLLPDPQPVLRVCLP